VATLDPLAPLCWRGAALWPDAIGTALVAEPQDAAMRTRIEEILTQEVVFTWATARGEHADPAALRQDARALRGLLRQRGWTGGLPRLDYALNPLLPCRSPALAERPVARPEDLLPALEAAAARAERRAMPPIDREMAAFLAARVEGRLDRELTALGDAAEPGEVALRQLAVLATLQIRLKAPPLPGLAGWLAETASASLEGWHNSEAQAARRQAVAAAVPAGNLQALLGILDDPAARAADARDHAAVQEAVRRLDARIASLTRGTEARGETALRLGQEISAVLGLAALAAAIAVAAFG
jgi:hypothetical protein